MLRQISTIIGSLLLFSCYGESDSQSNAPIVQIVGSGSDIGSGSGPGSGSASCPTCSGSACCDEPHATPPAEIAYSNTVAANQLADTPSVEEVPEDGVTLYNDPTNGCTQ